MGAHLPSLHIEVDKAHKKPHTGSKIANKGNFQEVR